MDYEAVADIDSPNADLDPGVDKNDQLTIEDLLKELIAKMGENIKIKRFARFEIGS